MASIFMASQKKILCLFDIDGTLTESRKIATPEMIAFIKRLSTVVDVAFVGGSDLPKQIEQLTEDRFLFDIFSNIFDYSFSCSFCYF